MELEVTSNRDVLEMYTTKSRKNCTETELLAFKRSARKMHEDVREKTAWNWSCCLSTDDVEPKSNSACASNAENKK